MVSARWFLIALIALSSVTAAFAADATYYDQPSLTMGSSGNFNQCIRYRLNSTVGIQPIGIVKHGSATATRALLYAGNVNPLNANCYTGDSTNVSTCTFSGNNCFFGSVPLNVTAGTNFTIAMDNSGSSWTQFYGASGLPTNGNTTLIRWLGAGDNGGAALDGAPRSIVGLYFNTTPVGNTTPFANFFVPSVGHFDFNTTVTVGAAFGAVESVNFTILNTTQYVIFSATLTTNASFGATEATCRILVNGTAYNSTATRSLSANTVGNFHLSTNLSSFAPGKYTFTVECLRSGAPPTAFKVVSAVLSLREMYDPHQDATIASASAQNETMTVGVTSTLLSTLTITTAQQGQLNTSNSGFLIAEWRATYNYGATTNISSYLNFTGATCASYTRYGASGTTGSVGGICIARNIANNTAYNIGFYGNGTGSIQNFHLAAYGTSQQNSSVNSTSIKGAQVNTTAYRALGSFTLTNLVGGSWSALTKVGINVINNGASGTTASFYVTTGTATSQEFKRTLSPGGQPGNVVVIDELDSASGSIPITVTLYGSCENANCTIIDGDFVSFIVDQVTVVPNHYTINVTDAYNGTGILNFNATVDGVTYTTTNGTVNVVAGATPSTAIVYSNVGTYFSNTTSADGSTNRAVIVHPWTIVGVKYGATSLSNFSLNYSAVSGGPYTTLTTTTGSVVVPIDGTYELHVFDVRDSGTNYSSTMVNVTGTPYVRSYNFSVQLSESVNITIRDEVTRAIITDNITVEVIGTNASNYTTTNGNLFLPVLLPNTYTLRYRGTNYPERDYYLTVLEQSSNVLTLYSIAFNQSNDVLVTVRDQNGDRIENATVKLLRFYTYCNCYEVVEMARTSYQGQAYVNGQYYSGHYKWVIEIGNETVFVSTTPENLVPESSSTLITRNFVISTGTDFYEGYTTSAGIAAVCAFNSTTGGLSFTWNDPTATITNACLRVTTVQGIQRVVVEQNCAASPTGSVVIALNDTNTTTYTYQGVVTVTGKEFAIQGCSGSTPSTFGINFGPLGGFLAMFVVLVIALIFSFSAVAMMIAVVVGVVFVSFLGLLPFTSTFITGLAVLVIGFVVYLMRQ